MRIPFQIPDINDTDEAEGFVYLEDDFLVFDVQVLAWGLSRSDTETVKVERGVIDGLRVESGWFSDRLHVVTRNAALLKALPGVHVAAVTVRTKKKYRAEVAAFAEQVRAWKAKAVT